MGAQVELQLRDGAPMGVAADAVQRDGGRYGAGIVRGVKLMRAGEFTDMFGATFRVDAKSLASMLTACSSRANGVPVHVTHAEAWGGDGVMHNVGEVFDFRISDDEHLLGDLHLGADAAVNPNGNLAEWIMARAEKRPHSFGMSLAMRGLMRTPDQDDPNTTPIFDCAEARSADIVGRPAIKTAMLSEGKPMADEPKTVTLTAAEVAELRARAAAADEAKRVAEVALAAERERTKRSEQTARVVAARARFERAVQDKLTVQAFRNFWCGEYQKNETGAETTEPVMVALSDGKAAPKHLGWAVAHPEMFEQFLALCSPVQSPGDTVTGGSAPQPAGPATLATIETEYAVALQAAIEKIQADPERKHLFGAALSSEARNLVASENPKLHQRYRATIPGRAA